MEVRGILGGDSDEVQELTLLGRTVRWTSEGLPWEADLKHRKIVMDYFGFDESTRVLGHNGDKEDRNDDPDDEVEMDSKSATEFRGLAARLNYMSQDCPDLQCPIKQCSRDVANPEWGSL